MNLGDVKKTDMNQLAVDKQAFRNHFREQNADLFQEDVLDVLLDEFSGDTVKPLDFSKWKDAITLEKMEEVTKRVTVLNTNKQII
ncbi:hypothetical protein RFI_16999 [Reticulomyxa filosa]|uniref:Uncharacterized protein n=1 Tax=Reticulomyxa filosa TaxID=46433 RepID=X6N392_RETFI|nr:hypothetical protein RFI_16999 [Reticulomyxa filosa]|eukprot:ETO20219.1 hypothetical protein RFI_16999 [Reticulomyxa filosa]